MAEKIPQHVHCHVCWKAIPVGEMFCSDECRQKYQKMMKTKKLVWYVFMGLMAAFLALIFFSGGF